MKKKRVIIIGSLLIIVIVLLSQTAFFHISPVKLGYEKIDFNDYTVYAKNIEMIHKDYFKIDSILRENEFSHNLKYKNKMTIIVCETVSELSRFLFYKNKNTVMNAQGFAPWPNSVYISPRAKERSDSPRQLLRHELSHILVLQNYGLIKTTKVWHENEWIGEGYATFDSGFPNYYDRHSLFLKMTELGIDYELDSENILSDKNARDIGLKDSYMIYRYFIEYLVVSYGRNAFVDFFNKSFNDPDEVNESFYKIYQVPISTAFKSYYRYLGNEFN